MTTTPTTTDTGGLARDKTLLDEFARDALKAMLSNPTLQQTDTSVDGPTALADTAYDLAEHMIREKRRRESSSC